MLRFRGKVLAPLLLAVVVLAIAPGAALSRPVADDLRDGHADLKVGKYAAALATLQLALKHHPKDARLYLLLGLTLNRLGNYKQAMPALAQAEKLGAKVPTLDFEAAWSAVHLGNYKMALTRLQAYEKVRPGQAKAMEFTGRAHLGLGNYPQAEKNLRAAMAKDPALTATSLYYLVILERQRDNPAAARAHLQALLQKAPKSQLAQNLARALTRKAAEILQDDSPATAGTRRQLLQALRKRPAGKPWSFNASLMTGYNDNVIGLGNDLPLPAGVSQQG